MVEMLKRNSRRVQFQLLRKKLLKTRLKSTRARDVRLTISFLAYVFKVTVSKLSNKVDQGARVIENAQLNALQIVVAVEEFYRSMQ